MRDPLSKIMTDIKPSGIRKFFDIVSEMKDAISLGVGEPDFDTPWHIREAEHSIERRYLLFRERQNILYIQCRIKRIKNRDIKLFKKKNKCRI